MLARRKERLPLYLRLLQRMEHSKKYPGFLLNNFHNLLRFWQQHYLHKDKDSTCLENVSAPPPPAPTSQWAGRGLSWGCGLCLGCVVALCRLASPPHRVPGSAWVLQAS